MYSPLEGGNCTVRGDAYRSGTVRHCGQTTAITASAGNGAHAGVDADRAAIGFGSKPVVKTKAASDIAVARISDQAAEGG
jgi:hypothetical protein